MSRGERVREPNAAQLGVLDDPDSCTLKRAAWAYGCAAKGSEVEAKLLAILIRKVDAETPRFGPGILPEWVNQHMTQHMTQPVPSGKPIRCHPGKKCENYPSCESCGPSRL